jgi:hypothetical protein
MSGEAVYSGVKRSEREVDHSPQFGIEVNNAGRCTSVSPVVIMAGSFIKGYSWGEGVARPPSVADSKRQQNQ